MNRRSLLIAIAALVGGSMRAGAEALSVIREDFNDVVRLFPSPDVAVRIGRHYLAASGENKSRAELLEELGLTSAAAWRADPLMAIRKRRHADFVGGVLVTIDGWVLARSEAAACGLMAMNGRGLS
jgi:hypothetical protein